MGNEKPTAIEGDEVGPAAAPAPSLASSIGSRNLLIIIISMPVVFLIVVMVTISVFGRSGDSHTERSAVNNAQAERVVASPMVNRSQQGAPLNTSSSAFMVAEDIEPIILPKDAHSESMALDGDRLALRIHGPDGEAVIIYDLSAGRVIATIPVLMEPSQ